MVILGTLVLIALRLALEVGLCQNLLTEKAMGFREGKLVIIGNNNILMLIYIDRYGSDRPHFIAHPLGGWFYGSGESCIT